MKLNCFIQSWVLFKILEAFISSFKFNNLLLIYNFEVIQKYTRYAVHEDNDLNDLNTYFVCKMHFCEEKRIQFLKTFVLKST